MPALVGHNVLHTFGHPVVTCCNVLGVVGNEVVTIIM